jgi:hypothetical protein
MPIETSSILAEKTFPEAAFGSGWQIESLSIFWKKPS